ncbi:MAG: HAD-IC family P-type ATPase, partial [Paracoccaceae bacterium]
KSATALERLAEIDTVVFDKTGTLTMGEPQLEHPESIGDAELALAASLAHASLHPFSRAILRAAKARKLAPPDNVRNLHEVAGCGVEAELGADIVRLGRAGWVGEADGDGRETWLKIGTDPARRLTFTETIRPGIVALIARLDAANIDVRLMTGDARWAAEDVARKTGIKNLIASADPAEKSARIAELSRAAHKVLMVGDGLNDTAALSIAHVSLSPASAIDAARVASDIVILGDDFSPLFACLTTARSARARIRENFALAALYNAVAVPVAVLGFATPLLAALAMSASSITVTLNSWRVR